MDATQIAPEQSGPRSNSLVGSVTNSIALDDTSDRESSAEVYPSLSGSTMSNSFHLKRKRSDGDDRDLNQNKTNAKSRFVGPRGYDSHLNSKRAVQPSYINQAIIQKLSKDPDMVIPEDSNLGSEYGEQIGRHLRLRKLHARKAKLIEELKDIWREVHNLDGNY